MIPLVRPSFPPIESWAPRWKAATDKTGQYSNYGQLWHEAAEKLRQMTGMQAFPCSSGTEAVGLAIQAAKSARDVRRFDVEAFTFEATHVAAERFNGFDRIIRSDKQSPWAVRTIPFGCGRTLQSECIVDAAGGFGPGVASLSCPIAVSFHATKNFPIGEGGCVFLPQTWALSDEMVAAMNFGFDMDRKRDPHVEHVGNGKLDELRCAVLLAQLERVDYFKARSARIREHSRLLQHKINQTEPPYPLGAWQSLVVVQVADAAGVADDLATEGFVARPVYSPNRFPELLLPAERNLLALPSDMTAAELERLAEVLAC
jgi:dTDP-4-amino-4,6-dideoxygalactose transaminase